MTEMSLQMTLTLADAASGPLRGFADGLAQLKTTAAGVSKTLESIAVSITNVSKAAAQAANLGAFATSMSQVSAAMATVRAESAGAASGIRSVSGQSSTALRSMFALEQATAALGGTLSRIVGQLATATTGLTGLAGATAAANAAAMAGNTHLQNQGQQLGAVNAQATTLAGTLGGLAKLWGAMKIEKGLKEAAGEGVDFQATQTRMKTMGMSASEQEEMNAAAISASRSTPQFDRNETLSMAIDLRNATGSAEHAIAMLPAFVTVAFNMKMATPEGKTFKEGDMLLIAKALEQRNATMDPAKMQAELDMFSKIYAATQGRVDAQQILGNLQYSRGGLGQSLDLSFMPVMAAMIEQVKSGGGNGGQVGTGLTAMQKYVLGITKNGTSAKEAAALGLIDPSKVVWNSQGNINLKKSDLAMAGAEEFQRNPYDWVKNYLKPALVRAGIDLANDAAVNKVLSTLFPAGTANSNATTMVNRGALLEKDAANINQAKAGDEAKAINAETAKAKIDAFKGQLSDLAIVMGTTLLPAITKIAAAFTTMFTWLAEFMEAHPVAAQFITWGLAIAGVGLAIAGFAALFGPIIPILGVFAGGLMTVVSAIAVFAVDVVGGMAAVGGAVTGFVGLVAPMFLRLIPFVGVLVAAWQLWPLVSNLEVGGRKISEWADDFLGPLVKKFEKAWQAITGFIVSMLPGAQAAEPPHGSAAKPAIDFGAGGNDWGGAAPSKKQFGAGLFDPTEGPGKTTGGGGKGRFAHYDEALTAAKEAYRLAEDADKRHAETEKRQYEANLISVDAYFDEKLATLRASVANEIAILEQEKAAYVRQGDKAGAARVDGDITIKKRSLQSGEEDLGIERKQALTKLDKEAVDLQRQLMKSSGDRHAAELLHIQEEMKTKLDLLVLNGKISRSEADIMLARSKAAIQAEESNKQIAPLQEAYADKLALIDDAEKNGLLTSTAAGDQRLALRQQEAAELDVIIAKTRDLYAASGNDTGVAAMDKLSVKNRSAAGQLPAEQIELLKATQTGFQGLFKDLTSGSMTAANAFKKFGQSIMDTMMNIISKRLGDQLFESLFGASGTGGGIGGGAGAAGGGGGGGGLMSMFGSMFNGGGAGGGIGSWFSGLFGSTGASSAGGAASMAGVMGSSAGSGAGAGFGSGFMDWLSSLMSFDVGTDYVPRDMIAMVHEGEKIVPAAYNKPGSDGGRMMNVTNHFTIQGTTDRRSQQQIAAQVGASVQRAAARAR